MRLQHRLKLIIILVVGVVFASTLTATAVTPDQPLFPKSTNRPLNQNHNPDDDILRIVITPETQSIPFGGAATFSIVVLNISDNVNLVNVTVDAPQAPDCDLNIGNLAADSNFPPFQCSRMDVQAPFNNMVHVEGINPINNQVSEDTDSAQVEIIGLDVVVDAVPETLAEPGGLVDFDLLITNSGSIEVSLQDLDSPQYGDLLNINNENVTDNSCLPDPNLPALAANGGQFACSFSAEVTGQPDEYTIVVTAVAADEHNNSISESGSTTVSLSDVVANLEFTLTASPLIVYAPGSTVNFQLNINNTSLVDSINIGQLEDNVLGNLNGQGNCQTPKLIPAGEIYTCAYLDDVAGGAGTQHIRSVIVTGTDDDDPTNPIVRTDDVTISIVEKPEFIQYMPLIIDTIDEPNDTCEQAFPLNINQDYYFHADDQDDWYAFQLEAQANVLVSLTNFIPVVGQIQIYKKATCDNIVIGDRIGFNGNHNTTKLVPLGTQGPGNYFIWIINDGITTATEPYKLVVEVQ